MGFSLLGLHSWLYLTLLPSIAFGLILLTLRVPGAWMWPVGAGAVVATLWGLHLSSGDTPDDQVWPLVVGLGSVALGIAMFLGNRRQGAEEFR